jgi:hypothetical protein
LLAAFTSAPSPRYLIADSKLYHEAKAPTSKNLALLHVFPILLDTGCIQTWTMWVWLNVACNDCVILHR